MTMSGSRTDHKDEHRRAWLCRQQHERRDGNAGGNGGGALLAREPADGGSNRSLFDM